MAKRPVSSRPTSTKKASKPTTAPSATDMAKAWGESRVKPPRTGTFELPDIPDGDYVVQVQSAKCAEYKSGNNKGTRYFSITHAIVLGEHTGVMLNTREDLSDRPIGNTGRVAMDLLSERLQRMGIDLAGVAFHELPQLAQELGDPKSPVGRMYLSVHVTTKASEGKDGKTYRNMYVNVNEPLSKKQFEIAKSQLS